MSPPSTRALPAETVNALWVKSIRALAAASSGVSGVMRTSLPPSARLPLTRVSLGSSSGTESASLRSALPLPLAVASARPVQRPIGVALT